MLAGLATLIQLNMGGYDESQKVYGVNWTPIEEVPTDIPPEAKRVDLNANSIYILKKGDFSHLSQCTQLWVGRNGMRQLQPGAFDI